MSPVLIFCAIILGIQIIYLSLFLIAFSLGRKAVMPANLPAVSVIVCAHDEEANLRELLPLLLQQDHPDFEVIIVEDRSNDGTYDYLLQATKENKKLRMIPIYMTPGHITGKKFALTIGVKAAKNEWVLLTDADCRPASTSWIRSMSKHFTKDKEMVIGFSPYQKTAGLLNSFIRFESFLTAIQYISFALLGRPYMGVGRNLAYRKLLFLNTRGFKNHLGIIGGDDDLFVNQNATKSNVAIALGAGALVRSVPKTSWRAFYYQKVRHLAVGKRYRFLDRFFLGIFSFTWILSWFCIFSLLLPDEEVLMIGVILVVRWIILEILFYFASLRLGEPLESWKVPFLDFIYAFYYLVAGPVALFSKKVRWKI